MYYNITTENSLSGEMSSLLEYLKHPNGVHCRQVWLWDSKFGCVVTITY
jgi:hypothetical protein